MNVTVCAVGGRTATTAIRTHWPSGGVNGIFKGAFLLQRSDGLERAAKMVEPVGSHLQP